MHVLKQDEEARSSCGVVYCAANAAAYLREAAVSAASVRARMPSISITLFTNISPLEESQQEVFDSIVRIPQQEVPAGWAWGMLARIKSLQRSPYDRTLHLDTDTCVIGDRFSTLFSACDEFEIAMPEAKREGSFDRRYFNRPIFTPSVMVYRRSERVMKLFCAWEQVMRRNLMRPDTSLLEQLCGRQLSPDQALIERLLKSDQVSLAEVHRPDRPFLADLRWETLSDEFNVRRLEEHRSNPQRSVILHISRRKLSNRDVRLEFDPLFSSDSSAAS
jgi:hypothetical protein